MSSSVNKSTFLKLDGKGRGSSFSVQRVQLSDHTESEEGS